MAWTIVCDDRDLAHECARACHAIGLTLSPEHSAQWFTQASRRLDRGEDVAVAFIEVPSLDQLVELAKSAFEKARQVALCIVSKGAQTERLLEAAADLGFVALADVRPFIAAIALHAAGATAPWTASLKSLTAPDRVRLRSVVNPAPRAKAQICSGKEGFLTWVSEAGAPAVQVGESRDFASAIVAMRAAEHPSLAVESQVEGVDQAAVLEVIFGPRRALSDPASKAALAFYGLAMPVEELCASASRAAAEATRIGFPVRVSLASPDLRVWDHPDLVVDLIDNAARVREVFGTLSALARSRAPEGRFLGVMVTAANQASALLQVRARPLPQGRVSVEVGFADAHGKAAGDATVTILPASIHAIERALERLRGSELILGRTKARRKSNLELIGDTLLRLAAFINDRVKEVESVELLPLALLTDGGVEVREACVTVSDSFERSVSSSVRPFQGRAAQIG
jgi:hypothetical protein